MTATARTQPARLRTAADIDAVFAARHARPGRFAVVHGRIRDGSDGVRVAVVASRRVGTAVRRNRAKRLLRESARAIAWRPGADVVLIARAACADACLGDVLPDVRGAAGHLELVEDVA